MYHRNRHHHRKKQNIFFPFFGVVFLFTFLALLWVSLHPEQIEKNTLPENVITSLQSSVQKNFTALYTFKEDPCRPKPTTEQKLLDLPLTLVTAASHSYFGHLQNLVGSVHYWEPTMEIAVIDLGLESKREIVEKWCHVTVLDFPFEKYPKHVRNLKNFAWKALVVQQGIEEFGKILYLDSGYELRRPIDYIKERIEREGYFCTGMGDSLTRGSRRRMFEFFNTTMETFFGKPMSAGGVHGATYWGGGYEAVIKPAVECSIVASCIEPSPSGDLKEVRSYGKDQPLFAMNVYRGTCIQCAMDSAFTLHTGDGGPFYSIGKQVLYHRRGGGPEYPSKIRKIPSKENPHPPPASWYPGNPPKRDLCTGWNGSLNMQQWAKLKPFYNTTYHGHRPCKCTGTTYLQSWQSPLLESLCQYENEHIYNSKRKSGSSVDKTKDRQDQTPEKRFSSLFATHYSTLVYNPLLINQLRQKVVIVTAVWKQNFQDIQNLVGSIHLHEPEMKVAIFNLGVSNEQRTELATWAGTDIIDYDLHNVPSHISRLETQAWRPGVIKKAIQIYKNILFLSHEQRLENRLETLLFLLYRDGVFTVTIGGNVLENVAIDEKAEKWFQKMRLRSKDLVWRPLCSTSVFGYMEGSVVSSQVIEKMYRCSLNEQCWTTEHFSKIANDYPFSFGTLDNLLLSALIYNNTCYTCNRDYDFYPYSGERKHSEPFTFNEGLMSEHQVLYDIRRGPQKLDTTKFIKKKT